MTLRRPNRRGSIRIKKYLKTYCMRSAGKTRVLTGKLFTWHRRMWSFRSLQGGAMLSLSCLTIQKRSLLWIWIPNKIFYWTWRSRHLKLSPTRNCSSLWEWRNPGTVFNCIDGFVICCRRTARDTGMGSGRKSSEASSTAAAMKRTWGYWKESWSLH